MTRPRDDTASTRGSVTLQAASLVTSGPGAVGQGGQCPELQGGARCADFVLGGAVDVDADQRDRSRRRASARSAAGRAPQADTSEHEERQEPAAIGTHADLTGAKGISTLPRRPLPWLDRLTHGTEARHGDAAPATRPIWIGRPWIDLVVGCGGWSLPLLLVSYFLVDADAPLVGGLLRLALVCNYPHYMATIHRAYGARRSRAYRLFTHHLTAPRALGVAAHVGPALLPWLFTPM